MALGQETLTHSRRPRLQNSSSGHAKPLIATRVARFLPVLDKSDTRSTNCSSSRTWSTWRIQSCHILSIGSARKPWAKSRGRLRALIMALAASGALRRFRAQAALVQLANGLQCLLQLAVVLEPPPTEEGTGGHLRAEPALLGREIVAARHSQQGP